jgi:hypothetical protein
MPNNVGTGNVRQLVDRDGDPLDDGNGRLNVNAELSAVDIQIGAVEIKDATGSDRAVVNASGELKVTAPPATFGSITCLEVTLDDDTNWDTFSSLAGKEVQIQSLSTNVDNFYIGDSSDNIGVELKPTDALSLPISNLNLLKYRKVAHTTSGQKLVILMLDT